MTIQAAAMDDTALLDLWEAGSNCQGLDRALLLLRGTGAARPDEDLSALPIGERDVRLLRERMRRFGTHCEATVDCPVCGERLAFPLDLDALSASLVPAARDVVVACSSGSYRLPNSQDIAAALGQPRPRLALALRCRLHGDTPIDEAALDELDTAMAATDPAALVDIALACQACGVAFTASFDIAGTFWSDVSRQARQVLDEVHLLASAYGWSEHEVLAVPQARRRHYLRRLAG
ncbi:MAG: hypothetical protein ACK515_23245 [bacterium]|nr:hypothetical protein [Betaproteobacteria bacterium]